MCFGIVVLSGEGQQDSEHAEFRAGVLVSLEIFLIFLIRAETGLRQVSGDSLFLLWIIILKQLPWEHPEWEFSKPEMWRKKTEIRLCLFSYFTNLPHLIRQSEHTPHSRISQTIYHQTQIKAWALLYPDNYVL